MITNAEAISIRRSIKRVMNTNKLQKERIKYLEEKLAGSVDKVKAIEDLSKRIERNQAEMICLGKLQDKFTELRHSLDQEAKKYEDL